MISDPSNLMQPPLPHLRRYTWEEAAKHCDKIADTLNLTANVCDMVSLLTELTLERSYIQDPARFEALVLVLNRICQDTLRGLSEGGAGIVEDFGSDFYQLTPQCREAQNVAQQ